MSTKKPVDLPPGMEWLRRPDADKIIERINAIPATGPAPWDIPDGSLAAAINGPVPSAVSPAHGQTYDDEWQPMSTAPKNATEIRVRMADGAVIERAHWACDLSGEEQPAFRGWFRPVTGSDGRVLHYAEIGEPVGWMALRTS